jgi:hypothetical protein
MPLVQMHSSNQKGLHQQQIAKRNKVSTLRTYTLQLLPHVCILVNQLRNLLLKTLVLFHKELVHCRQLSVHSLKP